LQAFLAATGAAPLTDRQRAGLEQAMPLVKTGSRTFQQLIEKAHFVLGERPFSPDEKAAKQLDDVSRGILAELTPHLQNASWTRDALEAAVGAFAEAKQLKLGKLAGPLRAALAGRSVTPSVFDMMVVLGPEETLARLEDAQNWRGAERPAT